MENISVSGMIRELRSKTSDIVGRYTEHLTNTITSAEAALDPKSLRSLGLGTIGLVRQHGIRITPDQLDDYIAHGNLSTAKDLQSLFKQYEVKIQFIRPTFSELVNRSYFFPCVVETLQGNAKIVINCKENANQEIEFYTIDPLDPTSKAKIESSEEFQENWSGILLLASKETGIDCSLLSWSTVQNFGGMNALAK